MDKKRFNDKITHVISKPHFYILFFIIISFLFCLPLFENIKYYGVEDWDTHLFYNAFPMKSIKEFHQFPLWNPYYCGGMTFIGNPQSSFLSPDFLFLFLFGDVVGMKIRIFFHLFLGMIGMFFLTKYMKINILGSYLAAFVFMLSSPYLLHLAEGQTVYFSMSLVPFVFLFYLKSFKQKRYFLLSGLFLAWMIFLGSTLILPPLVIFLSLLAFLSSIRNKTLKPIFLLGAILIFALLFSSIKLVPLLELMNKNQLTATSEEQVSFKTIYHMFFSRSQSITTIHEQPPQYGWHEYGSYVGILTLIICFFPLFFLFKRTWFYYVGLLLFLLLIIGNFGALSPWFILHQFPVYKSIHIPSRFNVLIVFILALLSGYGLTLISEKIKKKNISFFVSILIVLTILLDLFLVNGNILADAFTIKPPQLISRSNSFKQVYSLPGLPGQSSSQYLAMLSNVGTVHCYEPAAIPGIAVIFNSSPSYKGEVYYEQNNDISPEIIYFSPNKLILKINVFKEDKVIINQYYYPGWHVKGSESKVLNHNGLLSTNISSKTNLVTFWYLPLSFIIGLLLTVFSIFLFLLYFRKPTLKHL